MECNSSDAYFNSIVKGHVIEAKNYYKKNLFYEKLGIFHVPNFYEAFYGIYLNELDL